MGLGKLLQLLLVTFAILVLAFMLVTRVVHYFAGGEIPDDDPVSESAPEG
jgi:hypothetical protein